MESSEDRDNNQYYQLGKSILKQRNIDAELIFFCRVGSHSFNLNVETSDNDYFGVYEVNVDLVLSGSMTGHHHLFDGHEPDDFVMFDIGRFSELMLKGNPKMVEPLFAREFYSYASPKWRRLVDSHRHSLISQLVIYHYISYSKTMMGDARRLTSNPNGDNGKKPVSTELSSNHSPNKKMYHTIRLLNETIRMLDGKDPQVFLTGEHRDYIMSIRRGEIPIDQLEQEVAQLYATIDEKMVQMKDSNPNAIPPVADSKILDDWVVSCRRESLMSSETAERSDYFTADQVKLDIESSSSEVLKDVYSKSLEILKSNKVEGSILYIGRSGSHLHNLQVDGESSDDWFVVFASALGHVFSNEPTPTRLEAVIVNADAAAKDAGGRDTYANGIQLFEVGYFLSLLSQGNHRAVELFYGDYSSSASQSVACSAWELLREHNYLSHNFMNHCWGVAQGQLAKVKSMLKSKDGVDQQQINKHLYHSFRLLRLSEQVATSTAVCSSLEVTLTGDKREHYISIKTNQQVQNSQTTLDSCTVLSNKVMTRIKEKKNQEQPNYKPTLSNWLAKLRKSLSK